MSFQELFVKYKKEICSFCKNNDSDKCKICEIDCGVKCSNYEKDKEKLERIKIDI